MLTPILSRSLLWSLLGLLLITTVPVNGTSLYRWTTPDGTIHYSDASPAAEIQHESITLQTTPSFYRVEQVYDGDTVRLATGQRVRLIGINTPEVAHRNQPEQPGGVEASRFLQQRLEGKRVRMEFGPERADKYGRLLAHLYDEDGTNINRLLLEQGLAHAVIKPPSITHIDDYFAAEAAARTQQLGIWQLPHFQVAPIREAAQMRNSFRRLQGRVERVEENNSAWLIHFEGEVSALIRKEHLASFEAAGLHPQQLLGQHVTIRGWVQQSRGRPLIRLQHRYAIETPTGHTQLK